MRYKRGIISEGNSDHYHQSAYLEHVNQRESVHNSRHSRHQKANFATAQKTALIAVS